MILGDQQSVGLAQVAEKEEEGCSFLYTAAKLVVASATVASAWYLPKEFTAWLVGLTTSTNGMITLYNHVFG
jgi:hypothetical protein